MRKLAFCLAAACAGLSATPALAVNTIKQPGLHPAYTFEAEPHLLLGFDMPGTGAVNDGSGFGPGFRGTIEIVDNGFVKSMPKTASSSTSLFAS